MAATTFEAPAAGGSYAQRARWGRSPRFDFETGDIVLDGAGGCQSSLSVGLDDSVV